MNELLASFTIYGEPKPKGRPRFGKGHAFTPKQTVDAETAVVDAFEFACPLFEPSIEYLRVEADFYRRTLRKVDGDNLFKLLTDALNKVAYLDDEQIAESEIRRIYGARDKARTDVRIYILEDYVATPKQLGTWDIGDPEPLSVSAVTDHSLIAGSEGESTWRRSFDGGWQINRDTGDDDYLEWDELVRRWGPLFLPHCGTL